MRSCWTASFLLLVAGAASAQFEAGRTCFCKYDEAVESCPCSGNSIDKFNNEKVFPVLQRLLQKDFFKFYKVNMESPCPFWQDNRACASRHCGIEHCDDEVPAALRRPAAILSSVRFISHRPPTASRGRICAACELRPTVDSDRRWSLLGNGTLRGGATLHKPNSTIQESTSTNADGSKKKCVSSSNQFDPLDRSLTEGDRAQLQHMEFFEDNEDKFCDMGDEDSADMHYVNLLKNPERYTGYKGNSALKVWQAIYQENCFKPDMKFDKNFLLHPTTVGLCLEKRVFYRLISGLHTAITISIASYNYRPAPGGFGEGTWFRNIEMFEGRFGTKWTWEGPQRLKNLYFAYLLELRALVKAAPYLQKELFYTGNDEEDSETRAIIDNLMEIAKSFRDQFDETEMFTGIESHARSLREEFRQHFFNVSRIMDCVECDKCRLWGKVQTHGMGTALKILFSDLPHSHYHSADGTVQIPFQLTRNEVVSLFQSFGRYASSIWEVNEFRQVMAPTSTAFSSSSTATSRSEF
uniref:Endoplasmic oxidoreductin n=1 Tax=Panagrellus redivivus TaxID=6233 RepID=A0A7E4ZTY0_PANRE